MAWTVVGVVLGAMAAYKTTAEAKAAVEAEDDKPDDKSKDDRDS